MATRMRFMQADGGAPVRVECFICPPKLKLDKDQKRVMTLVFSVKLDANTANLCDEKIRRAFEDTNFLEREISSVELTSQIDHSDVEFYELPLSAGRDREPLLTLRDTSLFAIYVERVKSETYLYFQCDVMIGVHPKIGHTFQDRFGTVLFGEFKVAQGAIGFPNVAVPEPVKGAQVPLLPNTPEEIADVLKRDPAILQAMAEMVRPLVDGNLTSLEITIPGTTESFSVDRERAVMIFNAAKTAKRRGKGGAR